MSNLTSKSIIELLAAVKSGRLTVIRDEYGQIKGVGVNHPDLKVSEVKYVKQVANGQVIGNTLEELAADEAAMREWASKYDYCDVIRLIEVAETLNKPTLDEDDVDRVSRALQYYVDANKEVVTREVTRTIEAPAADSGRGRYPALLENLYALDIDTLKEMKRQATRSGASDLKNACRTVLRHKGVNC